LTGSLACYRIYRCADGEFLTVAALEAKFWSRLCELVERPDLLPLQNDGHAELEALFATRASSEWLSLFEGEDVAVGPVSTLPDASQAFGEGPEGKAPPALGEHTERWRAELASFEG
jgi:crotonobetainyl-CoA:carnitine CoA-transferase CaiB-like acyl-CoA transferase